MIRPPLTAPAPEPASPFRLPLSSRGAARLLWPIVAALIAIHLGLHAVHHSGVEVPWDLHLVFNVDSEPTVPTWYSSLALFAAAQLLAAIARARRRAGDRDARYWWGLAAGFVLLSLDEVAALHEMVNTFVSFEWTLPGALVVIAVGASYVPFLRRLPARFRHRFLLAGAVFLSGALVVEYLTGPQYFPYDIDTMPYAAVTALEEGLEMSGVVLWIGALLRWMEEAAPALAIELDVGGS